MRELYEFKVGSEEYLYASSEIDITFNNKVYQRSDITRSDIVNELENQSASISMSWDTEPAPKYRVTNPSSTVLVTIRKENGLIVFIGRVSSCSFNEGVASMKLSSMSGILKTKIPSRTYSADCSFELFEEGCEVRKIDYQVSLLPSNTTVSNLTIKSPTIALKEDTYYAGGYAQVGNSYSTILTHKGDTITLMYPLQLYTASSTIYIYAGCNKARATCKKKFNNEKNFGGYPFVPSKNPITEGF